MCGFVGFLAADVSDVSTPSVIRAMADRLHHRGPDDAGVWVDADAGVALGFRRLAIVDLTEAGHQPMVSASGRYVVVFNGEIYNHMELRSALGSDAPPWRGRSDTETLLAAIDRWGLERTLTAATGMFAFALWDRQMRHLSLARDRMGEKPCYYGWHGGRFFFGSELGAFEAHQDFRPTIDRGAVAAFLRSGFVPAPSTIFEGFHKLPPGTTLHVDPTQPTPSEPRAYWSLREAVERGRAAPFDGDDEEAVDALHGLLDRAIGLQRVADVPLGAFLSGGIDSSLIVAMMEAQRAGVPVRTFTIGFSEPAYDESGYARAVARHLGTEHHELTATPEDALALVPSLAACFDEPFGDPSALPTLLLAELARQHVTVALSGDGGDELFGGYGRYRDAQRAWRHVQRIPHALRGPVRGGASLLTTIADRWSPVGPTTDRVHQRGRSLRAALGDSTINGLFVEQGALWKEPCSHVVGACVEASSVATDPRRQLRSGSTLDQMTYADAASYLPDDILVKVDRAAMHVSLETRIPLLDHRVVEFAWSLPAHLKQHPGGDKQLLRRLLRRYVPDALIERPKMGFGVPLGAWLRGPLKEWASDLLATGRLRDEGLLHPEGIQRAWDRHRSGDSDVRYQLWPVLMLEAWLDHRRVR
jgi:asparagine synthase (glutamine-hydrolysing)